MAGMPGRIPEKEPGGQNQEGGEYEDTPAEMIHQHPDNRFGQGWKRGGLHGVDFHHLDTGQLDDHRRDHGHHEEHAHGRIAYLPATADVIADQIAGASQELQDG